MKLFLDTAFIDQIQEVARWGILDGVTTNPTHVSKTGANPKELYPQICKIVDGPVSLETISLEADGIAAEGRELAKIADNVVIKVPIVKEGLIAVKKLAAEGIKTNVTVNFSALQALLAAKAGATYISPFVGRLDSIGHDGMELAAQIRQIYDNYGYETQIIVAAVRHPIHVLRAALIGADVCTMNFEVMGMLYDHPLTDIGIDLFLKDWEKVPK
ncbi:MAG: fructose-6-phosphate aldolase [Spirochaetaceae bacterium]|nr:MAG: fructose-6-phosphate aldolase [Spirochaetaceae bacterium]